ncbi:MAG: hypothetical protein VR64_04090 [Desulfatitalea sp. BRH_c12]|nr:MAG: hypothetical protein VR64_04090 [Desulfatitalea sp. BRH_c12]
MNPTSCKRETAGDLLRISLLGCLFLALAISIRFAGPGHYLSAARQWANLMAHDPSTVHRIVGFCFFIATGGLLISVGIPRIWISAAAGAVYGLALGLVLAMAASILGSAALFWMGKTLLSDMLQKRAAGKIADWKTGFEKNAFWWVLYLRLFPLANATLTSLLCGTCRIPFGAFAGASLIGFLPYTLIFAAFGDGGWGGNVTKILVGFALLGATMMVRKWIIHTQSIILSRRKQI